MASRLRDLISDRFLRELHHFLWSAPEVCEGRFDPGWACRDHAWITALLAQGMGHHPLLTHGEACFALGPTSRSRGHLVRQKPHTWITLPGVGAIDLSVKASSDIPGNDFRLPIRAVFAGEWLPRGRNKVHFAGHTQEYARTADFMGHRRNLAGAVYLATEFEQLHRGHLSYAAGWIQSMRTQKLDAVYGNPTSLYAALLMHLRGFLEGSLPSLADLPIEQSWARLAEARDTAIGWAKRSVEISMPPMPADSDWITGDSLQPVVG